MSDPREAVEKAIADRLRAEQLDAAELNRERQRRAALAASKKKQEEAQLPPMASRYVPPDDVKELVTAEPRVTSPERDRPTTTRQGSPRTMGGPTTTRKIDTNLVNVANTLYEESGFTEKTRLGQTPVTPTPKQLAARIGLMIIEPILGGTQEALFPFAGSLAADRPATMALRVTGALATPTPADYVFGKVLGGASSLLRRTGAKISSGVVEIPISNGGTAKWKGLYVRLGKHSKLLSGKLSLYDEAGYLITKIDDGTQILPAKGATRGYVPQTEIDVALTKDLMKMLEYTADEFDKIDNVIEVIKSTKNTKSKFISDVLPQKTNTLSEDGVKAFIDFAKKNQDDVEKIYGSFAVKNQLNPDYNFGLPSGVSSARLAGDIDVLIKGNADDAAKVIENIYDDLIAAGENVRIDPNNPLMIQARVDNKWAHAIDGHAAKEINLDALYAKEWGFKTDQPGITIEDVLSQSAGEQSIKKGTSILGFLDDGTLGPVPHRGKDIVDFVHVSQTLEDSKAWWSKSVQDEINAVKKLYGVVTVDDLDNIYAKLQKTEFVFKKSGGGGSLSPASFYASLGLPLGSVIASSSLTGSSSPTPSSSESPSSPPSEPSRPPDEVSPPTEPPSPPKEPPSPPSEPPSPPKEPPSPPSEPPSPPSEPPSPPPDEPSPPPSQPGPSGFKKPKSKKRRKLNLKLFKGPKKRYRVQHKYIDGTKTTVTVQAQSHPEAVAKAEGNRNRSKRLKEAISEQV